MTTKQCHYCGSTDEALRPYGPGGACLCFPCMTASPEREAEAKDNFGALLQAAVAASPHDTAVIGTEAPSPMTELPDPARTFAVGDRICHRLSGDDLGVITKITSAVVHFSGPRVREGEPVTFAGWDEVMHAPHPTPAEAETDE